MSAIDPISDFLTQIRNGLGARHKSIEVPASRLKLEIARILKEEGYVASYKLAEEGAHRKLEVRLRYGNNNEPIISTIQRVSRPGRRVYVGHQDVPRVMGGLGINILTTPQGVMTGRQARQQKVGGEVLCEIW
ncbi:MAG: 30S ribosomal protein S8 [Acidobacteria bacterium]|jgi:small subunit ribosomal protein S8|nr:30S ribosomal protein S8 [Acidobacteriota bacterium]